MSTYLPIYVLTYLPIYIPIYPLTYLSIHPPTYLHLSIYIPTHTPIYLSIHLPTYIPTHPPTYTCSTDLPTCCRYTDTLITLWEARRWGGLDNQEEKEDEEEVQASSPFRLQKLILNFFFSGEPLTQGAANLITRAVCSHFVFCHFFFPPQDSYVSNTTWPERPFMNLN